MSGDFIKYGIRLPVGAVGQTKVICPKCTPHDRKPQNRNAKDLSVNVDDGVWNCKNCGWAGCIPKSVPKKEYTKPSARLQKVSNDALTFFSQRGISNDTLLRFKVTETTEWMPGAAKEIPVICFNYYQNDELINIKFRGKNKDFKMPAGSELIFYNIDSLKGEKTAVIVEGEIDCLAMHEAGIFNSVSTPNGAPPKSSNGRPYSPKLEYLDNCWQDFEHLDRIVIATDNDEVGRLLMEELARRLGKQRCAQIQYPEGCKDANDVLINYGKEALKQMVEGATDWPLEGIVQFDDVYPNIEDWFLNGYPEGAKAGVFGFDDLVSFVPGQMTIVTGIPGSGKDEFMNEVKVGLSKNCGWLWGLWEGEEPAPYHMTKLMEKVTKKSFAFRKNPDHRMTTMEFEKSLVFIADHFYHIDDNIVDATIDSILEKAEELVKKFGINGFEINPWNCIDHKVPHGYSETQYISECLTKIINFGRKCNVHVILIAHPTKIMKDEKSGKYKVPTMYSISGSAHFFNKTHNGICVYRDFETNIVDVYVQKVKWSWLGKIGFCSFRFDTDTRQYLNN